MIESYMLWIWLGIFVLAVVLEAITQDFVSIWFSVGALVALIVCSFTPFWGEIIVFSVVSCLALVLTRPLARKLMERSVRYTNVDEFMGKRVKVEKDITKFDAGEVKVNGVYYTAVLMEDVNEPIEQDSIVEIIALKGNKIVVKKLEKLEESGIDVFK